MYLIGLILGISLMGQAQEKMTIQLSAYLKNYLAEDETLESNQLQYQSAVQHANAASDVFQSELNLEPTGSEATFDTPIEEIKDSRQSVKVEYLQSTPWGTAIQLRSRTFTEAGNKDLDTINQEKSITIQQSLWQNSFGGLVQAQRDAAETSRQAAKISQDLAQASSCIDGVGRYLLSYRAQRRLAIVNEQLKLSNRALRVSETTYKKRLLRKIDIIGARADSRQIASIFSDTLADHKKSLLQLFRPVGQTVPERVTLLRPKINFFDKKFFNLEEQNPRLLLSRAKVTEKEFSNTSVIQKTRPKIDIGLSVGNRDGSRSLSGNITDYSEEFASVYLSMQWPVINNVRSAEREIAANDLRTAQLELDRAREDESAKLEQMKVDFDNLKIQMTESKKKVSLFNEQVDESLRLLNSGRIEFWDYQRASDQLLAEKLHQVDLEWNLWKLNMQWGLISGSLGADCGGLL